MRFLYLLLLLISFSTQAQIYNSSPTCSPENCPECPKCEDRGDTEGYRKNSTGSLMLGYQFLNTWVVGKKSVSYTHNIGKSWGVELEYATSKRDVDIVGIDLGELKEDRYTLFAKYFVGNSFHVSIGPYMYDIEMETDDKLQDTLGNRIDDKWELEGYGLAFAFGNRWQTNWGLTYGIDWVRMNMPLVDGKIQRRITDLNADDKEDVKRSYAIFRRVPAFTFLAVNIGYTF
jgi:hypothetical protein